MRCMFFFFQAEDGIRDLYVTGVQTCALPIFKVLGAADLVLCLGYDPVEMRDAWIQPWDPKIDSAEIAWAPNDHHVHWTGLEFVADLRLALGQLVAMIPDRGGATWPDGVPAAARAEIQASLRPKGVEAWGPHAV